MTAGTLSGAAAVAIAGIVMAAVPLAAKPTVPFGVRVPPERAGAPVIRVQRRAYAWRTAAVGACCTAAVLWRGRPWRAGCQLPPS